MTGRGHYPNFVRGASGLGVSRLRELAARLEIASTPNDTAEAVAAALLRGLGTPGNFGQNLDADDLEPIGIALGVGKRSAWKSKLSAAEFERLPFYCKPSYDGDVLEQLEVREDAAVPKPRPTTKKAAAAKWPELATLAKWAKAEHKGVAKALAKGGLKAPALAGTLELPRVRHVKLGVDFVAIPGGTFEMGLGAKELKELKASVRGGEAADHLEALAKSARPAREVKVAPFLVAIQPLTRSQLGALDADVVDEMPGDAARTTGPEAARAVATAGARLLSEAEWEWLARCGGTDAWLSGSHPPDAWAERHASGSGEDDEEHAFGVAGLGWGEWVDDGWHASYRGAPATSAAWEPLEWPIVTRGGALAVWPWHRGGEVILCHAAARDRALDGVACVRLALDLPTR